MILTLEVDGAVVTHRCGYPADGSPLPGDAIPSPTTSPAIESVSSESTVQNPVARHAVAAARITTGDGAFFNERAAIDGTAVTADRFASDPTLETSAVDPVEMSPETEGSAAAPVPETADPAVVIAPPPVALPPPEMAPIPTEEPTPTVEPPPPVEGVQPNPMPTLTPEPTLRPSRPQGRPSRRSRRRR